LIETDDDNAISWEEFEKFFVAAGTVPPPLLALPSLLYPVTGFTNESMAASKSMNKDLLRASGNSTNGRLDRSFQSTSTRHHRGTTGNGNGNDSSSNGSGNGKSNVSYVIEQCESEFTDTYRECMKSATGQCLISRLAPGQTYRFRVYGVNVDGVPGPKSESIVVHTMLETPAPPVLNTKSSSLPGMEKLLYSASLFPNKVTAFASPLSLSPPSLLSPLRSSAGDTVTTGCAEMERSERRLELT
jgi:hypothetical protein